MQNNTNIGNGQSNQRPRQQGQPVRPQMQGQPHRPQTQGRGTQGQRPVRPQMQGQQGRPQGQRPVRPEYEQSPNRVQQNYGYQHMNEHEQSNSGYTQYNDNNFEDFNSGIVNDTVAENKARGKQKIIKEKKVLTPEQKKKRLIILGVVLGAIILIGLSAMIISKVIANNSKHIIIADDTPQVENVTDANEVDNTEDANENTADTENTEGTEQTTEESTPVVAIDAKECSKESPLDLGEYSYMDLIVNAKTAQDKAYVDREAKVYVRLSNVVTGYNSVYEYIRNYNKTNKDNKNINVPSDIDYYTMSNGSEIAMFEFELLYPENFPTSASEGIVYRIPYANIEVFGTTEEIDSEDEDIIQNPSNYIVVDDTIYTISNITDISVYEKDYEVGIKIGEPIRFRYITALPTGSSSDSYGIKLSLGLDVEDEGKDSADYWFKGQSITASEELISAMNKIEQEGNTENTEGGQEENTDSTEEENEGDVSNETSNDEE